MFSDLSFYTDVHWNEMLCQLLFNYINSLNVFIHSLKLILIPSLCYIVRIPTRCHTSTEHTRFRSSLSPMLLSLTPVGTMEDHPRSQEQGRLR